MDAENSPPRRTPFLSMGVGVCVGLFTGMYSMGLQGRAVFKPRLSYLVFGSLGAFLGYKVSMLRQRQAQLIEVRREILLERRARRLAEEKARAESE
ncbi:hypothetical protein H4R19_006117 [Coemansia spiralis]|nr:hypothetical protein H4R19_006117 [Coemansia spiralis]